MIAAAIGIPIPVADSSPAITAAETDPRAASARDCSTKSETYIATLQSNITIDEKTSGR